jgi:hypothetical protein
MSEPFAEMPQESAETTQPPEPARPREKRARSGIIAGAAGMTALVVLFVLLFAAFNNRSTVSGGAAPTPTIPAGWQRYTDPGGHFTMLIPNGWTVYSGSHTSTVGDAHGSVTLQDIFDSFGGPPNGQNTITVSIFIEPIENDQARQWMCRAFAPEDTNTTLAGLPAVMLGDATWLVESSGAHFQIDYGYPNYKGGVLQTANSPTATPMPPGFYAKGQQDFHTILASFMPTPDTPLKCS